jgi:hypothetical protein
MGIIMGIIQWMVNLVGSWFTLAQNGYLIFPYELQSNLTP